MQFLTKKFVRVSCCILIFFFSSFSYGFSKVTGEMLLNACKPALKTESEITAQEAMRVSFCTGYIGGFRDAHFFTSAVTPNVAPAYEDVLKRQIFCIPYTASGEKMISSVVKFLENNPSKLNDPAGSSVMLAFKESFPCAEKAVATH
jgi:hypothetical protein